MSLQNSRLSSLGDKLDLTGTRADVVETEPVVEEPKVKKGRTLSKKKK